MKCVIDIMETNGRKLMADPTFAVLFRYAEGHNDLRAGSISTELSLISTEILLLPTKVLVVTVILVLYFSHIICTI